MKSLLQKLTNSQVCRSIFRSGLGKGPLYNSLLMFNNFWLHLHPVKVRKEGIKITHTFCLGGISFLLFIIVTVTGILLMFYYVPDTRRAYYDMKDIQFVVPFGMLLRNLHRWAAHGMVIMVILHMARVFYTGSYKPPREFNWVIGVMLLVATLLLSFTGYLLPWDQLAFWAITVGTNMGGASPFLGSRGPFADILGTKINNDVRFALLGGTQVGQNALLRFYVLHVILLPLVLLILVSIHFWRIRKDGGISGPL